MTHPVSLTVSVLSDPFKVGYLETAPIPHKCGDRELIDRDRFSMAELFELCDIYLFI